MEKTKRHLGVSLIALIITIAVLVIIAGAVLFRGGLDRIPWAKGGVHSMDKSVVAESVELYAADKSTYPVIKIKDVTGTGGVATATGVLTAAPAVTISTDFTPDTTQIQYDGIWYNVSAVTTGATGSVTIVNPPAGNPAGKSFTIRYCNPLDYEAAPATALTASYTNGLNSVTLTTANATWLQTVGAGTQIKIGTTWYDVSSRYSDTVIYLTSNFGGVTGSGAISIRQSGYVDSGSYIYPLSYISADLLNKAKADIPGLLDKGNGVFQVVDMKGMADNNYITKTSDKGFAAYNPTTGAFDSTLLNPATNPDKFDQIYIRHSTTGLIYYVEGVKAENNQIKY